MLKLEDILHWKRNKIFSSGGEFIILEVDMNTTIKALYQKEYNKL